jgi:hypothetical protein
MVELMRPAEFSNKWFVFIGAVLCLFAPSRSHAQATLLLEEPYSYDGEFAGTGHAAVYLSRVCADTPTHLRRCRPGENGSVISRYHGVAGRDWMAIPLIPYLYAVDRAEDIPLFVNGRLVSLLRERYLSSLPLPEESHPGSEPRYELAGSAYDRTLYGFRIETRPEQDDALIELLNSSPNKGVYALVSRNCADFAKHIINFYYPHAIHRSIIADLGVTTPKQAAKSLARRAKHHPEMHLTTFIVPQVPGLKRSKPVHGVLESLVLAKKYVTPVLLFHPFVVGTVEAAYWAGWRFDPAKNALIFNANTANPTRFLEPPLTAGQRRSYQGLVSAMAKAESESEELPDWHKLESLGTPQLDARGRALLQVQLEGSTVALGLCRSNANISGSPELVEGLLLSRLQHQLKSKKSRASETMIQGDWQMLQEARQANLASLQAEK